MDTKVYKVRVGSWVVRYLKSGWIEEYPEYVCEMVEGIDFAKGRFSIFLPEARPEHWKELERGGVFGMQRMDGGMWAIDPTPQQKLIEYLQRWMERGKKKGLRRLLWGVDPLWREGDPILSVEPPHCSVVRGRLIEWVDESCPTDWIGQLVRDLDLPYPPLLIVGHSDYSAKMLIQHMLGEGSSGVVEIIVVSVYDWESYLIWQKYK